MSFFNLYYWQEIVKEKKMISKFETQIMQCWIWVKMLNKNSILIYPIWELILLISNINCWSSILGQIKQRIGGVQ